MYSVATSHDGKRRYKKVSDAAKAAARLLKQKGEIVRPYHCEHCPSIHLGHPVDPEFRPQNTLRNEPGPVLL